jgi:hypothetical protein
MSYFDDASLVMIPSGYKTDKVYSVKPTDGTGDLTFTRSNDTATRVGPDGLIEKVRTNLALYSEQLDNAYWIKAGSPVITVTANAGTAPDGTTTADRCSATSVGTSSRVYTDVTWGGGEHTLSLYVKNNGGTNTSLRFSYYDIVDQYFSPTFTLTDEWQRITFTFSPAAGAGGFWLVNTPIASGDFDLLAWGVQLETGVTTDYIATTSAAVSVGPVANVPRLDYLGSSCPRLLLEPQRTNLITFSEQMDNAAWTKSVNTAISANAAISPDGYQNADTITWSTSGGTTQLYQVKSTTGTSQTLSLFVKYISGSGTNFLFSIGTIVDASINLTFTNSGATLTGAVGVDVTSYKIEDYGNNWFRVSFSANYAGATSEFSVYRPSGTGTDVYAIYGAQLESNTSYATSYTPTLGSASTRAADAASKTGISSLLSSTEYTLYWEGTHIPTGQYNSFMTIYKASDLDSSARFYRNNTNNEIRAAIFDSVSGLNIDLGSGVTTQTAKCALRVKAGDYALYVNGNLVNSTANALAPSSTLDAVNLQYYDSSQSLDQKTGQVLFFKTALSNADLAALTA